MEFNDFWRFIEGYPRLGSVSAKGKYVLAKLKETEGGAIEILRAYLALEASLNQKEVWGAGVVLNCGVCSEEVFEYFRGFLVASGEEVYRTALDRADELAVLPAVFLRPEELERLARDRPTVYVTQTAMISCEWPFLFADRDLRDKLLLGYWIVTQRVALDDLRDELHEDRYIKHAAIDDSWKMLGTELIERYPRLCKLMNRSAADFDQKDPLPRDALRVAGLGTVRTRDVLRHGTFGRGIVIAVRDFEGGAVRADVMFRDGLRNIALDQVVLSPGMACIERGR